ncbi:MAG: hypothetical protein M0Q51_11660 [Bacteroidales bacterium]|nr:hypothetical protein [Bacteroidales bacterium]
MRIRLYLTLLAAIFLVASSSCYIINFSKDFEFDLTFEVNSDTTSLNEIYLLDAVVYNNFEEYVDYIETIEIKSATYSLTSFSGTDDQTLTNGLLTVSDENGSESQVLATLPTELLQHLLIAERTLNLDEAGINMVEGLIKNAPHKCQGILTGDISSSPVNFTMKFHFLATITGSLL